jgi:type II secretory pathway component GspD/PulD (secretin)
VILPALLLAAAATVSLDVKDADVRVVLKSMQQQCGIKNLLIDKDVQGEATILFRDVPCATAFKVVFRQFGLTGQVAKNVTTVETRRN